MSTEMENPEGVQFPWGEILAAALFGVGVVVWGTQLFRNLARARAAAFREPFAAGVRAEDSQSAVDPETLAVISATLGMIMDGPFRVGRVTPVGEGQSAQAMQAWSVEGRRQIYSSHQIK